MAKRSSTPTFEAHIAEIQLTKQRADEVIAGFEKNRRLLRQSADLVYEMFFDQLGVLRKELPKMEDMAKASTITSQAVQNFLRLTEHIQEHSENKTAAGIGLPPALRDELERDLKIM